MKAMKMAQMEITHTKKNERMNRKSVQKSRCANDEKQNAGEREREFRGFYFWNPSGIEVENHWYSGGEVQKKKQAPR